MSYNTELQANNEELQYILNTVNALPNADSGGNVDYGAENAGKLLYVGADGFATVLALGAGLAIVNGVLTITSQQVTADTCGESTICGNTICGGA